MKHTSANLNRLAQNVLNRRHEQGITQVEPARWAGCSVSTVSQLERAEGPISVETLFRIASGLDCRPPNWRRACDTKNSPDLLNRPGERVTVSISQR